MYSTDLTLIFQDYAYTIDSTLKSITFAFASTDYPELVGIDSVRIEGDRVTPVPEPSLIVLLGISVLSLVGLKRWWKE